MRFGAELAADYGPITRARHWERHSRRDDDPVTPYKANWFDTRLPDPKCKKPMRDHGLIKAQTYIDYDQIVCPGDWVVTTPSGLVAVNESPDGCSYDGPPRQVPGTSYAACNDCDLIAHGPTYRIALKNLGNLHMLHWPGPDAHKGDLYIVEKKLP